MSSIKSTEFCSCSSSSLTIIDRPNKHLQVEIHHGLFSGKRKSATDSKNWYDELLSNVKWHRVKYKSSRFQSDCETPCYTAFYGGRKEYKPYTPVPDWIKPLIKEVTAHLNCNSDVPIQFNAFLLRLYFDGNDEIAWHTDGRTFLGAEPTIASLSLGNKATFQLRRMHNVWPCVNGTASTEGSIDTTTPIESFVLQDGDLLVMKGKTQQYWHHRVPKEKGRGVRLNINFRYIMPGVDAERGQMTYYKYMVYGDVPIDQDPPSWTFDVIMKKKGGIMNFVKGGVKRKAAAAAASANSVAVPLVGGQTSDEKPQDEAEPKIDPLPATSKASPIQGPTSNLIPDIQQYLSSQNDIDEAVFNSLPIEIQHELVTQRKLQNEPHTNEQTTKQCDMAEKKKSKLSGRRGTLNSFFAKK
jgi:alkylated DNA repair dioxygenase AlkB